MSTTTTPGHGGNNFKRLLALLLGGLLACLALAATTLIGAADAGPDLTCENADEVYYTAASEISQVVKSEDLSENEKREQLVELRKERDAAKAKIGQCAKDSDETTTTTASGGGDTPGDGTPGNPHAGNEDNQNPVIGEARSWTELINAVEAQPGGGAWYWTELDAFNGITMADAYKARDLEEQGKDLRFILASNTSLSDSEVKAELKAHGVEGVDGLPIVRVNGFINTRGVPANRMEAFWDPKSQIRVSLGIPNNWSDLSKGLQADRGVLTMCGNGWKLKGNAPAPAPAPAPGPTPTAPPATPTTQPPVTTPPTVPPTVPPTTQPPVTTTTRPPVTTTQPPVTTPPKLCGGPGQPSCTGTPTR